MNYRLLRINSQADYSMGVMFAVGSNGPIDDSNKVRHLCYTLEDEFRLEKVSGETRIPAGTYELKLRREVSLTKRYETSCPNIHEGRILLHNVQNIKWRDIRCGSVYDDIYGCLVVGSDVLFTMLLN